MNRFYYILAAFLLTACSSDNILNGGNTDGAGLEITTVDAHVDGSSSALSRAAVLVDTVGRLDFVTNDCILFTNIQRTTSPISSFTYTDGIKYKLSGESSWERISLIENEAITPERIYWSDAESEHTFKGYGCPQSNFDWNKVSIAQGYYRYYGSLGDPTLVSSDADNPAYIDYSNDELTSDDVTFEQKKAKYLSGNTRICNDDILLACNAEQKADLGGQVATIKFYHGLCNVRVVVNISGFSPSADAADSQSKVTGLVLQDMLTMYKWDQQSYATLPLVEGDQEYLNSIYSSANPIPTWDQKKTVKTWIRYPEGKGAGQGKTFTFYALAVPTTGKSQKITFYVTYPDPMNPYTKTVTKPYTAVLNNVEYRAGHCTTINISLNHQNDQMTVGAEYMDWQFVETPDDSELKKHSTFLNYRSKNDAKITTHNDAKATADDATWLYKLDNGEVVDIYGHDGNSKSSPYTITSAEELLSFAYEVKEGFKEEVKPSQQEQAFTNSKNFAGKYIKLDADITLQPSLTTDRDFITWVGIGDDTHSFDGFFFGNGRHINRLYGGAFFKTIGVNAVIDKLHFANTVEVHGTGVVADVNKGLICSCNIEGDIKQDTPGAEQSYCGSFVGDNQSFIIACTHIGQVIGHGYVGGLVGRNGGTIISSYHVGLVKYADNATHKDNVGASTGLKEENSRIFSSYFNEELIDHTPQKWPGLAAFGCSTAMMQSYAFVNSSTDLWVDEGIDVSKEEDAYKRHFSLNYALGLFCIWLKSEVDKHASDTGDWTVKTNCREFTKNQVLWIQDHFGDHQNSSHSFQYTPGAYPKVQ